MNNEQHHTMLLLATFQSLSGLDGAILLACVALAAATLIFIFFIDPDPSDSAPHRSQLDQLLERRDTLYENLRDLKFEHRAGKYSESDFEQMKQSLETEAALVLTEIERVTGGSPTPAVRQSHSVRPRFSPSQE
ncbi:MAG TPA: hypothetical protein VI699_06450 [Candidatus Acidoferrales bacterium]|nr:hypothetical protein [Candidatus Acidoferrales bacterium]